MKRPLLCSFALSILVAAACGRDPAPKPVTPAPTPMAAAAPTPVCVPWQEKAATPPPAPVEPEAEDAATRRRSPQKTTDLCETADTNLARAEKAILASNGGALAPHPAWDGAAKLERLDLVASRLSLTRTEREKLARNGFVVLGKARYDSHAWAFHEVYQSQLPIWISADAILHAVYASNDHLIADIEADEVVPILGQTLSSMQCELAGAATSYPPDVARDLDLYVTVALSLLSGKPAKSVLGTDAAAAVLVAAANKAEGIETLDLFGRSRVIDWSAYLPRGHYARPEGEDAAASRGLDDYFRAGMWLSRLEMNLVSRSSRSSLLVTADPRETPREALVALALADLVERSKTTENVTRLDRIWSLLAGRREDVSIADLMSLRKKAGIARIEDAAFEKLKAAIGNDFQRTARVHPMPEGSTHLPAIATFLGPRVVADTAAFRPLVHAEVAERRLVRAGDVAYVLGLDRGRTYLKDDLVKHGELTKQLDVARSIVNKAPDAGDLYGAWLGAIRGVATKPQGVLPSFMDRPAYDDLRVNSIVAAYGQIRHNYVLMAGQSYDEGGCVIPDGWVEPLPGVYEGIVKYAERGAAVMKALDPADRTRAGAYFAQLANVARVLHAIVRHELEGRALTAEEKNFLSMVAEMLPGGTGSAPKYTGWYFDIYRGRSDEALAKAGFVADFHTSAWTNRVQYAGVTDVALGVFVIDAGGPPRLAVGPVARAYELTGPLDKRYTDESVVAVSGKESPWATSYAVEAPPTPKVALLAAFPDGPGKTVTTITVRAPVAIPKLTIEILDHHRRVVAQKTIAVAADAKQKLTIAAGNGAEGIRVRVGEFSTDRYSGGPETSVLFGLGGVSTDDLF